MKFGKVFPWPVSFKPESCVVFIYFKLKYENQNPRKEFSTHLVNVCVCVCVCVCVKDKYM